MNDNNELALDNLSLDVAAPSVSAPQDARKELEQQIAAACIDEANLRAATKVAKEHRVSLVEKLQEILDGVGAATIDCDDVPPTAGAWGRESVECFSELGLSEKKIEALVNCGKFDGTVVGLRDWIAKAELWHRDVKGLGPAGADKVIDALNGYYQKHPITTNVIPMSESQTITGTLT